MLLPPASDSVRLPTSQPFPSPSPNPTHLQLSDRHDLLPSQLHLAQLWSGQLCHPVPALLRRTRGHPTGPGPGPGFPKAQMTPETCVKGEMGVRDSLARGQQFCPGSMKRSLTTSPERRRDLIPCHSCWTHQPTS